LSRILTGPGDRPYLVGRANEHSLIVAQIDALLTGKGSLVILSGEAGIGKTTLAQSACREARESGALVLLGHCYDRGETPPYGLWIEPLEQAHAWADRNPGIADSPAPRFGGSSSQAALFTAIWTYFTALARDQPLVIFLDDVHWADEASLDLLRFLARQVAPVSILLLITYRTDEVTRHDPLYRYLPALVREAQAVRVDLSPLSDLDVRALIDYSYQLPADDTDRLVSYLQVRAQGNPFFFSELLRSFEGTTLTRTDSGGWALRSLDSVPVPTLLRQVIDARIARLDPEGYELLAVAATIGQLVPIALWAAVGGTTEPALLRLVEQALEIRIFDATADGLAVVFVHALIREALYEGVSPPRRRRLHRVIAEALLARPGPPDPDMVAYHFSQAADDRAAEWLLHAGDRARRAFAWSTAALRFESVLTLLEHDESKRNERGWVLLRLALLRRFTDPGIGIGYLEEAERLGRATEDAALVAYAHFYQGMLRRMGGNFRQGTMMTREGVALLDRLSPLDRERLAALSTSSDPLDEQNGRGDLALAVGEIGPFEEARALGEQIVSLPPARTAGSRGDAYYGMGYTYAALGKPEAAREAFARAREIFRADDHRSMIVATLFDELVLVVLPYQTDQLAPRQQLEGELNDAFAALVGIFDQPSEYIARAVSLVLAGEWSDIIAAMARSRLRFIHLLSSTILGPLAWHRGDVAMAWELVREGLPAGLETLPGDSAGYIVPLRSLAVRLALDEGNLDLARRWLDAFDRWLAWSGAVRGQAEAHLCWTVYLRAQGSRGAARARAMQAREAASDPRQPLALSQAHRLLGELDLDAGHLADAEAHLSESAVLAGSCGARHEEALTSLAFAELCRKRGDIPAAHAHLDAVYAMCTPMEARRTLGEADALARRLPSGSVPRPANLPAGLTARETEVLRLLAAGMTNAEIAAQLSLSPRTVNAHLTSVYGKLGVATRGAAIRFAIEHGIR